MKRMLSGYRYPIVLFSILSCAAYFDPNLRLYQDTLRSLEYCEFRPWGEFVMTPFASHFFPVTKALLGLLYNFFGGFFVGYSCFNIGLHVLCSWLLFKFLREEFGCRTSALVLSAFFAAGTFATNTLCWKINLGNQIALLVLFLLLLTCNQAKRSQRALSLGEHFICLALIQVGLWSFESFLPLLCFWGTWLFLKLGFRRCIIPGLLVVVSSLFFLWMRKQVVSGSVSNDATLVELLLLMQYMFWNGLLSPTPFGKLLCPPWLCYLLSGLSAVACVYAFSRNKHEWNWAPLLAIGISFLFYLIYSSSRYNAQFDMTVKGRYHYLPMVFNLIFIAPWLKLGIEKETLSKPKWVRLLFLVFLLLNIGMSRVIIEKYWLRYDRSWATPEIKSSGEFLKRAVLMAKNGKVVLPDIFLSRQMGYINLSFAQKLFHRELTHANLSFVDADQSDQLTQPISQEMIEWQKTLPLIVGAYEYGVNTCPHPARSPYLNDYQKDGKED